MYKKKNKTTICQSPPPLSLTFRVFDEKEWSDGGHERRSEEDQMRGGGGDGYRWSDQMKGQGGAVPLWVTQLAVSTVTGATEQRGHFFGGGGGSQACARARHQREKG